MAALWPILAIGFFLITCLAIAVSMRTVSILTDERDKELWKLEANHREELRQLEEQHREAWQWQRANDERYITELIKQIKRQVDAATLDHQWKARHVERDCYNPLCTLDKGEVR